MLSKFLVAFCATLLSLSSILPLTTGGFSYSDPEQFASVFLENVAKINLSNYEIASVRSSPMPMPNSQHNKTAINIAFGNKDHNLSAIISLIDGKFCTYNLYLLSGNLNGDEQTFNTSLVGARSAIEAYTRIFNASHGENFVPMISEALETQKLSLSANGILLKILQDNALPLENTKLQFFEEIRDGLTTPFRSVSLSVSKAGFISCLVDNRWYTMLRVLTSNSLKMKQ
jgi:hypothetical protein